MVTLIRPLIAPTGTADVMVVLLTTPKVAGTPLKLTAAAFVKLTPVIVTLVPAAPLVGVNPLMLGGRKKFVALTITPFVVPTVIGPLVAAGGTVAVN